MSIISAILIGSKEQYFSHIHDDNTLRNTIV